MPRCIEIESSHKSPFSKKIQKGWSAKSRAFCHKRSSFFFFFKFLDSKNAKHYLLFCKSFVYVGKAFATSVLIDSFHDDVINSTGCPVNLTYLRSIQTTLLFISYLSPICQSPFFHAKSHCVLFLNRRDNGGDNGQLQQATITDRAVPLGASHWWTAPDKTPALK